MCPVVEIGSVALRSYSLCFILAVSVAILILCLGARAEGLKPIRFFEMGLLSTSLGILGARAMVGSKSTMPVPID